VHRGRHAPGRRDAGGRDGAANGLGPAIRGVPAASGAPGAGARRAGLQHRRRRVPALGSVSAAMLPVSGSPFGVAATAAGRWAFVAVVGHIRAGLFPGT
jgi:hypothetical protein